MSKLLPSEKRYNDYVTLFSTSNDDRVKKWLHEMYNVNASNRNVCTDLKKINVEDLPHALTGAMFKSTENKEWNNFFADVNAHFKNTVFSKESTPREYNVLQRLSGACFSSNPVDKLVFSILNNLKKGVLATIKPSFGGPRPNNESVSVNFGDVDIVDVTFDGDATVFKNGSAGTRLTYFNFVTLNSYIVKRMLEESVSHESVLPASKNFFDDALSAKDDYVRKDGMLMKKDASQPNGLRHIGDEDIKKLTEQDKCFSSGVTGQGGELTCQKYFIDCLEGKEDGIAKCKNFLLNHNFYNTAHEEVKNMLPQVMVLTLKKFKFNIVEKEVQVDRRRVRLNMVETFGEWVAGLKESDGLSTDDIKNIAGNDKLEMYLNAIVSRVNANPAIINPNYGGPKGKLSYAVDPKTSLLSRYGLKQHEPTSILSSAFRLGNLVNPIILSSAPAASRLVVIGTGNRQLRGGAYSNDVVRLSEAKEDDALQSWSLFNSHYLNIVNRLKAMGKEVSPADHKQIVQLINNLRENEQKLIKATLYAEKYAQLMEVYEQQDTNKVLSLDQLQKFVDARNKYFEKVTSRKNALTTIIETVTEIASNGLNEDAPSNRRGSANIPSSFP